MEPQFFWHIIPSTERLIVVEDELFVMVWILYLEFVCRCYYDCDSVNSYSLNARYIVVISYILRPVVSCTLVSNGRLLLLYHWLP